MASVHLILTDTHMLFDQLNKTDLALEEERWTRIQAVINIQRYFRGYQARVKLYRLHSAATTIQKYYRRLFVKRRYPEYYRCLLIQYRNNKHYYIMATRIQALWRGYFVLLLFIQTSRTRILDFKKYWPMKLMMDEKNKYIFSKIRELISKADRVYNEREETEAKAKVLAIASKLHHFLRTDREGIYSIHGSKSNKLSWLERAMKEAKFTDYMNEIHLEYNKNYNIAKFVPYLKGSKRNVEEAYHLRNRDNDPVPIPIEKSQLKLKTPFVFDPIYRTPKYEQGILSREPYRNPAVNAFERKNDRAKNVSKKEFIATPKIGKYKAKPPPYHITFWDRPCPIHNVEF